MKWQDFIFSNILGFVQSRMYEGEWNPQRNIEVDTLQFKKHSWVYSSGKVSELNLWNASSYAYDSLKDILRGRTTSEIRSKPAKRGELTWNELERRYNGDTSGHWGIEGRITKVYIGKLARNRAFFEEEVENTYSTATLDELNKAKAYWGDMWNGFGHEDPTAIHVSVKIKDLHYVEWKPRQLDYSYLPLELVEELERLNSDGNESKS
jgi:hypothetical protein